MANADHIPIGDAESTAIASTADTATRDCVSIPNGHDARIDCTYPTNRTDPLTVTRTLTQRRHDGASGEPGLSSVNRPSPLSSTKSHVPGLTESASFDRPREIRTR